MGFVLNYGGYYIPIDLQPATKEREDITHFYYGCKVCGSGGKDLVRKTFCNKCGKDVDVKKFYPEGKKQVVGSKDMWDFVRVPSNDVDILRIYSSYNISKGEIKKPKASEIEKWKEEIARMGKSRTLKDLFVELTAKAEVIRCKVVFSGRKNDCWVIPNAKNLCLTLLVADGNRRRVNPKESYAELLQVKPIKVKKGEGVGLKNEILLKNLQVGD